MTLRSRLPIRVAVLGGALLPAPASADQLFSLCLAGAKAPASGLAAWSLAPEVVVPLLGVAAAYGLAYARGGIDAEPRRARLHAASFVLGYLLLLAALVSPLCRMAAATASGHMVQHVILVALAPPLLVLGLPARGATTSGSGRLPLATALYGVLIWAWHLPTLYQAALVGVPAHLTMYVSLIMAGLWFWREAIAAWGNPKRAGAAVLALLATFVQTGLLGALLTFSPRAWYPLMASGALSRGLMPMEDQQLAGLIMWVPMGAVYLVAALVLAGRALARVPALGPQRAQG